MGPQLDFFGGPRLEFFRGKVFFDVFFQRPRRKINRDTWLTDTFDSAKRPSVWVTAEIEWRAAVPGLNPSAYCAPIRQIYLPDSPLGERLHKSM